MRKFFIPLTMICTTFFYSGACIAETVKEDRKTEPFSKISSANGIDVYYTQSSSYAVTVEADKEYIDKIITKTEGKTLVVKLEDGFRNFALRGIFGHKLIKVMKVYVSAPTLDEVKASGGSDFYADKLKSDNSFQLKISGGADAEITDLTVAGDAEISASGGADADISSLTVTGNADVSASGGADADISSLTVTGNADVSASGGADCDIKSLRAVECKLSASGGGDINVGVELSGNLKASASGGADIDVSGKANDVVASASGGSDINLRKLSSTSLDIHKSGGSDVYR
jgi:hypothetical protein